MAHVNRKHKDTLFRLLFSEKNNLLQLYNGVNHTDYDDPDDLEINTLQNATYMKVKNDVSFVIADEMHLYEHQSTVNLNMPLRDLFYASSLLRGMVSSKDLYRRKPVQIPTPRFLVFYNGVEEQPEHQVLKLSDLYEHRIEQPEMELTVRVLNINEGKNKDIVSACRLLHDYVKFVALIRENQKSTNDLETAIKLAIDYCIGNGILADFLRKHRAEAEEMCWWEYNEELHLKNVLEEGREMERENTERERLRADHAEARAEQAEAEVRALKKELENYRRGNPDTR